MWALVSLFLALAQFRLVQLVMPFFDYENSIIVAKGVVDGLPHWVIYQSRILGPYTVKVLSLLTGSFVSAHVLFFIVMQSVAGYLLLRLTTDLAGATRAWTAFWMFQAMFSLLMSSSWIYAWDNIGIILSVVFFYFVAKQKDWRWFSALFCIGILNRESAFFIAVWMILDPLTKAFFGNRERESRHMEWKMAISGGVCILLGAGLVIALRTILLVREIGPEVFSAPSLAGSNTHIRFSSNISFIDQAFSFHGYGSELIVVVFFLFAALIATRLLFSAPARWAAMAVSNFALLGSILAFASLRETRVLLELIPVAVMGVALLLANNDGYENR